MARNKKIISNNYLLLSSDKVERKYWDLSVMSRAEANNNEILLICEKSTNHNILRITKFNNIVLSFDHRVCFLGPVYMEVGFPDR